MKKNQNYMKSSLVVLLLCGGLFAGCAGGDSKETMAPQEGSGKAEQESAEADRQGQQGEDKSEKEFEKLRFVDSWGDWHSMTVNPNVEKHPYDWSRLTNIEDEIKYEGDERYSIRKGIDASEHQGIIDWEKVSSDGYEFAMLRIGYRGYGTAGSLHVDAVFHENITGAKAAGLDVGVYFFSQAVNEEETLEEAALVLENLKGYELELPVVFDPERIRNDTARTDDVSGEQFTKNTVLFCEKMKEAGYQPMIYSNLVWEAFEYDMEQLADYPIWYADYEAAPQTPYRFTFWQYSEKGRVDGIDGAVDLNVQFCEKQ